MNAEIHITGLPAFLILLAATVLMAAGIVAIGRDVVMLIKIWNARR